MVVHVTVVHVNACSSWYKGNTVSSNYIDKGHTLKGMQADMRRVSVTKLLQHTRSYL